MAGPAVPTHLLGDRYRLHELIAVGGMGEVWRATDELLGREVAVKVLRSEYVDDPSFRARFRAEARMAAGLSHPGIAHIFDYGESTTPPSRAWLVMELVDGEPLSQRLQRSGALPVPMTLDILSQAALALAAAHRAGVVHRDVKPGNLLIRPDGTLKVTDFGIAHAVGTATLTEAGTVLGTAYYLSPEQAAGHRGTPASDLYALGAVGYECLAGVRPFDGTNPVAIALAHQRAAAPPLPPTVPPPVAALIAQALAKDPAERPTSAATMGRTAAAVREALYGPSPLAAARGDTVTDLLPADAAAGAAEGPGAGREEAAAAALAGAALAGAAAGAAGGAEGGPVPTRAWRGAFPGGASATPRTRLLPEVGAGSEAAARPRIRRRIRAPLAGLVILALLLLGGLLRGQSPAPATVPRLAGLQRVAALSRLSAAHLRGVVHLMASSQLGAGLVITTRPAAGLRVRPGSTVIVEVSSGPARVLVAATQLLGQPAAQDVAALRAEGLTTRTTGQADAGAAAGTVIGVSPTGLVPIGTAVTLTVATAVPTTPAPGPGGAPGPGKDQGKHSGH